MSLAATWRRFLGGGVPAPEPPADLPQALLRLQRAARSRIAAPWAGAYRTAFKGQGLEFAGVREYVPGDDSRTIDWRVTARTGRLAVRRYVEERDRTVLLVVDVGAATDLGSGDRTLREVAAEVVALVGSAAQAAGDRVGLVAWSDRPELLLPPTRRTAALLRMVGELLRLGPRSAVADLDAALATTRRLVRHRGVVVVVSPLLSDGVRRSLAALATRHQTLVVRLTDPRAGRGWAGGRLPAVGVGGAVGSSRVAAPPPLDLAGLGLRSVTVTPRTELAAALARAFSGRVGGARG